MNWYYALGQEQKGPVSEAELEDLVRNGTVRADTLVWREGMPDWQPYAQASGATDSATPAPAVSAEPTAPVSGGSSAAMAPDQVTCAECGGLFPRDQTIPYGDLSVCANCKPVFFQKIREGATTPSAWSGAMNYGGFWIRAGAKIIDGLIMAVVMGIPIALLVVMMAPGADSRNEPDVGMLMLQVLIQMFSLLIAVGYNTFFIGRYAATPGKMACGLRVVTAEGGKVSYARALGRGFAEQLSGMVCYIGYLIAGFDDEKRTLHDHICSTRVIRTR